MRCLGRQIDPAFRENYCGQKRVKKSFPCGDCDLNSESTEGKAYIKKGTFR